MNPSFLEKLAALELSLSRAKGAFELFAVLLREGSPEKWDLVVAAPWLDPDQRESFKTMAEALQAALSREEFLEFSRIVILKKGYPFLESLLTMISCEHGMYELRDITVSGISIRIAHVMTAMRRPARKRRRNRDGSPAR
jgi:hypothetical protein